MSAKKSKAMIPLVVKVDPSKLDKLKKKKHVQIAERVRALVDEILEEEICPCCKQKLK